MRVLEHVGQRRNVRRVQVLTVGVEHAAHTPVGQGSETFGDPGIGVGHATGSQGGQLSRPLGGAHLSGIGRVLARESGGHGY
jgi:hypothetical protein